MDENHQDKTESKPIATEETLPPSSFKDQRKLVNKAQSQAGKAFTKPSVSRAKHPLLVVAMSAALVGVIALVYLWFKFSWPLGVLISLMLIGIALLFLFIRIGYTAQWTGFRGYEIETQEYTDGKLTKTTKEHQPGKTFWDWLQLVGVLLIPLVIFLATVRFNQQQADLVQQQHEADQQRALDQQRATILQTYIDNIQDLLLNHNLLNSKQGNDLATLARARTLAALQGLDPRRRAMVVQFLYDAKLINGPTVACIICEHLSPIINLTGADLSGVDLSGVYMNGVDLSGVYMNGVDLNGATLIGATLSDATLIGATLIGANLFIADLNKADLSKADLNGADLSGADLSGADLSGADLSGADLSRANIYTQQLKEAKFLKGAIMPDGSRHP